MGRVVIRTIIRAPMERCFDLARDVEVHCRTSDFTGERVLPPGRTVGLLELGDTVRFEGRHFGVRLAMTARIVEMRRPGRFVDEVIEGPFAWLRHVHDFTARGADTEMLDILEWRSPLGPIGTAADRLFVEPHMSRYLTRKQHALKRLAEDATAGP